MKIRELLTLPLMSGAKVLAAEKYVDQNFTWCCQGTSLEQMRRDGHAPDFLLIYTGRAQDVLWKEYLGWVKEMDAAAILLVGRQLTTFDIAEEEYLYCEEYGIPLIWIPVDNIMMFMTRLQPFLKKDFRQSQGEENWLYDLCYKNTFMPNEAIAEKYGYNLRYKYVCFLLELYESENIERQELERAVIKAWNAVDSYFSQGDRKVLHFSEKESLVCFLPVRPEMTQEEMRKQFYRLVEKLVIKTSFRWEVTVGTKVGAVSEFFFSFQNAVKTAHVARRFGCHAEVDFYDDWQTNMLPLYAPYPEIEAFVQKWMGPVLDNEELLDTLNIYIITKGNQQKLSRFCMFTKAH